MSVPEILAVWLGCFKQVVSLRKPGEILGCHGTKTQCMGLMLASPADLSIPHYSNGSWLCLLAKYLSVRHFTNICETPTKFLVGQACTSHLQMFLIFKGLSHLLAHFNLTQN